MEDNELLVSGIGISKSVIAQIVSASAERVKGVARVGGNDIASNLISVFTSKSVAPGGAVESEVVNDELEVTVHLAVFYGYPFTKLAEEVRAAVDRGLRETAGFEPSAVNVCIDSLVFPKE